MQLRQPRLALSFFVCALTAVVVGCDRAANNPSQVYRAVLTYYNAAAGPPVEETTEFFQRELKDDLLSSAVVGAFTGCQDGSDLAVAAGQLVAAAKEESKVEVEFSPSLRMTKSGSTPDAFRLSPVGFAKNVAAVCVDQGPPLGAAMVCYGLTKGEAGWTITCKRLVRQT